MSAVRTLAPAKINLALEVTGRREDGYHAIDTVMTTLDLADRIVVTAREAGAGLEVALSGAYARGIDVADDLSGRGARALAKAAGRAPDVRIELTKRIPSPAGLGGGASDAAAVLRALNVLWGLGWPPARLAEVGAGIGSDVPFFCHGGTARCTGRGEVVEPLPDLRPLRLLLLVPAVPMPPDKTRRRYAALHAHDFSDGSRSERLARRLQRRAPPPTSDLINAFEAVVERTEPELVAHYATYNAVASSARFHLCGSGPAVYLFVHEGAKVAELRRDFERVGATVIEARTLPRAEATRVEPA
jgi:4-diphosphocytidyl-2-C-methyl-D-erythritol kinase